jgi:protein phosphatase-4 regulatory subunit 3
MSADGKDGEAGAGGSGGGGGEGEGGFLKEELLLSTKVEKEDIYARQQGELPHSYRTNWSSSVDTLIVWTEPQTNLDIALSFQDPDGCEDIWSFVCDVQRHLNNLPSKLPHTHTGSS